MSVKKSLRKMASEQKSVRDLHGRQSTQIGQVNVSDKSQFAMGLNGTFATCILTA